MIAVVVINYRRTAVTLACLESLYANAGMPFRLFLVDNASSPASRKSLEAFLARHDEQAVLLCNQDNLGFAAACNQAIGHILATADHDVVALLNNDTLVTPGWLMAMARALDPDRNMHMVASRMLCLAKPHEVDSLGIVFYRSGIASNRKSPDEPLLGPCAGAALYSTKLLRAVQQLSGHVFDPVYFCYAEDTDLALRARALGFDCAQTDDAVVLHHGSLSSGGGFNEFVAYHGLRNSLFALLANLPPGFFLRNAHWILLMQAAVALKYLVKGRPDLLWRIHRDVLRGLPRTWRQRRIQKRRLGHRVLDWRSLVSERFYDPVYLRQSLWGLYRRDVDRAKEPPPEDMGP